MTGKRVFWYFSVFFGFIAAVNAVMMTLAIRTHRGVVTDHAYEKGLAYNQVVEAKSKQEVLGWKGSINYANSMLSFTLQDKNHLLLIPDKATATIIRPTEQDMDFTVELKDTQTEVNFPVKGVWDVRVDATVGDKPFQQTKRIIIE